MTKNEKLTHRYYFDHINPIQKETPTSEKTIRIRNRKTHFR